MDECVCSVINTYMMRQLLIDNSHLCITAVCMKGIDLCELMIYELTAYSLSFF